MANVCGDDRFELIAMARKKLIDGTNISDRPYEMDALDSILFRCWQMGWLDQLRDGAPMTDTEREALCARIDELCQENERLRQQNAKLDELLPENERWFSFDVVRSLNDERDQLVDENAQLRELCRDMVLNMGGCALHGNPLRLREFGSRAHEFGIEVGNGTE